jgi:hypothetical protein
MFAPPFVGIPTRGNTARFVLTFSLAFIGVRPNISVLRRTP